MKKNEIFFNVKTDADNPDVIIKQRNESDASVTAIRVIIMFLTLALLFCVYLHYNFSLKMLKIKQLRLTEG